MAINHRSQQKAKVVEGRNEVGFSARKEGGGRPGKKKKGHLHRGDPIGGNRGGHENYRWSKVGIKKTENCGRGGEKK